jgi:hypothetical protein
MPVDYTFSGGRIYGRSCGGAKFEEFERLPAPVVLQIDEAESLFRLRSVVARGRLQVITPDGSAIFRIEVEDVSSRAMN